MARRGGTTLPRRKPASFGFEPGQLLAANKYEVVQRLGGGWEGETYLLRERATRVERAGKFFFPARNPRNRTANRYARKLHQLRDCSIVVGYHTRERLVIDGVPVVFLVSEFVQGDPLPVFLKRQPGGRLRPFAALHLLHALACGIQEIHAKREYHGDLHDRNVLVERFGLTFQLKLLDLYNHGRFTRVHAQDDLCDIIRIFFDAMGGRARYAGLPPAVKHICCGLRRSLIVPRFRSVEQLRRHLERLEL